MEPSLYHNLYLIGEKTEIEGMAQSHATSEAMRTTLKPVHSDPKPPHPTGSKARSRSGAGGEED